MTSTNLTKECMEPGMRRVLEDDSITIKEIRCSKPDVEGAHFESAVKTAEVLVTSGKSQSDRLIHIFMKQPLKLEAQSSMMEHKKIMVVFQREAEALNIIIPEMINFSKCKGVKLEESIPVCYFAYGKGDESSIILEDLSIQGYKLFPYCSTNLQDIDHVSIVLTALAKFHAVSYSMKKTINFPETFPTLEEIKFVDKQESLLYTLLKPMFKLVICLFDNSPKIQKDMDKFYDIGFRHLIKQVEPKEPFNVINHGDFWNNNMLFKYDDNGKPTATKLVDWPELKYCSLAVDLVYYLHSSTSVQFRKNHLQDMLKLYYKEFADVVNKLGTKIEFTFDQLLEEYMSKRLLGYMMTPTFLTIGLKSKDDHSESDGDDNLDQMGVFETAAKKLMADRMQREIMVKMLTDAHDEVEQLLDEL